MVLCLWVECPPCIMYQWQVAVRLVVRCWAVLGKIKLYCLKTRKFNETALDIRLCVVNMARSLSYNRSTSEKVWKSYRLVKAFKALQAPTFRPSSVITSMASSVSGHGFILCPQGQERGECHPTLLLPVCARHFRTLRPHRRHARNLFSLCNSLNNNTNFQSAGMHIIAHRLRNSKQRHLLIHSHQARYMH